MAGHMLHTCYAEYDMIWNLIQLHVSMRHTCHQFPATSSSPILYPTTISFRAGCSSVDYACFTSETSDVQWNERVYKYRISDGRTGRLFPPYPWQAPARLSFTASIGGIGSWYRYRQVVVSGIGAKSGIVQALPRMYYCNFARAPETVFPWMFTLPSQCTHVENIWKRFFVFFYFVGRPCSMAYVALNVSFLNYIT